ncbi:hypothetical protein HWI77_05830 [Acinetobacter venetianus]|nr:hypothetical protein HWI77_05830 [Acinetobacter venetianus]
MQSKIIEWLENQEQGYIFNRQNFIPSGVGNQYLIFDGYVVVSSNVFKNTPEFARNTPVEIPYKSVGRNVILSFTLDELDDVNDDFLIISRKNDNLAQCYLHYKILKSQFDNGRYDGSPDSALISFKLGENLKDTKGEKYTVRTAKEEIIMFKNYLINNSL